MDIEIKTFNELDTDTLYDILQLRSSVFVVEQNCVYQDIDGKDKEGLHIILKKNGTVVAYTRCFAPGVYFKEASIGRVVGKTNRKKQQLRPPNNENLNSRYFSPLQYTRN